MTQAKPSGRFYSLDVLRGLAALSVVFWHWQHFFLPFNTRGAAFVMEELPLFPVLAFFYRHGSEAVLLFFCLSGFIFFWLYSQRVAERAVTVSAFTVLRLSRLYPLHFATLLFVAVGQWMYQRTTGSYFVYPFNDLYHFVLNFLFASSWGFERGLSFNAPVWSVSVEIFLYAAFFVFCRLIPRNLLTLAAVVLVGHFIVIRVNQPIASGVEGFFLGGLAYLTYGRLLQSGDRWKVARWLPAVVALAWLVTFWFGSQAHGLSFKGEPWVLRKLVAVWAVFLLFPTTILALALLESRRGTLGRRLAFVGDISYSSYLLHFPLQLAVVSIVNRLGAGPALYSAPWFLAAFFVTLILVALAVHHTFERPMQRLLRRLL